MYSEKVNEFIAENYDRLHVLTPKGTKALLRRKFKNNYLTINKYINLLIDLDLRGCVRWSEVDMDVKYLKECAAYEIGRDIREPKVY